jgi:hypothetical protein
VRSRTGLFRSFSTLLSVFARSQALPGNALSSRLRLGSIGLMVESRRKKTTRNLLAEVTNNYSIDAYRSGYRSQNPRLVADACFSALRIAARSVCLGGSQPAGCDLRLQRLLMLCGHCVCAQLSRAKVAPGRPGRSDPPIAPGRSDPLIVHSMSINLHSE